MDLSGATLSHREDFTDVIARVTLGEVGIILSYEVTRLARNNSDWYTYPALSHFFRITLSVGILAIIQSWEILSKQP